MKFTAEIIKRAWKIRREVAKKLGSKIIDVSWKMLIETSIAIKSLVDGEEIIMDNDTIQALVQVDSAMMGKEWQGDSGDLRRFCEILQALMEDGYRVVAITDSHNGAIQVTDEGTAWAIDEAWPKALAEFYETKKEENYG